MKYLEGRGSEEAGYSFIDRKFDGMTTENTERRHKARRRVLQKAQISFGFSGSTIDCLIANESQFGLLVETDAPVTLPDDILIRINNGETKPAIVRWMLGTKIGIEFKRRNEIPAKDTLRQKAVKDLESVKTRISMLKSETFCHDREIMTMVRDVEDSFNKLCRKLAEH